MGIKKGALTLHSITNLTLADIAHICRRLAEKNDIPVPRVVADCSNLVYIFKDSYTPVVASLANFFHKFTVAGIVVAPVCDGHIRPTAKQATNIRIADQEKSRISALQLRSRMREIKASLSDNCDESSKAMLEKQLSDAEKKLKKNESMAKAVVPPNFSEALENELCSRKAHSIDGESAGGCVEEVIVAEFQADSYMTGQIVNRNAVMAITRDTDIPIIGGDCCMAINEFTKNKYRVVGTSESTLRYAMSLLPKKSSARFKPASHAIFDGITSPRLRALMMVILGCDVYLSGMNNVSVNTLAKMIDKEKRAMAEHYSEEALFASLHRQLLETNGLTSDAVNIYVCAIIYEPTNTSPIYDGSTAASGRSYLFEPPLLLPKYLEQFSIDDNFTASCIVEGPHTSTCKGVGERTHIFFTHEGHTTCTHCNERTCMHCCKVAVDKKSYCLHCYATNSAVPLSGCAGSKTIADMRRELKDDFNFDHVDTLTSDEVEEAYDKMEFVRVYKGREDNVPFPIYASNAIDECRHWSKIVDIELQYGGAFLADPAIQSQHIPGILHLFGSMVTYDREHQTGWMKQINDSMPAMLLRFAAQSRLGCGYRLLARCARHTFDSKMPPPDREIATLIFHDGEVGIHLSSKVPASMKNEVYQSEIVVTPTKILCCRCTCPCGSQTVERVVCVHNLPLLLNMSVFIGECLGEHLLMELAACWNSADWDKNQWSDHDLRTMKNNVLALMVANDPALDTHSIGTESIDNLLAKYKVGTDGEKKWAKRTHRPPKPSDLCPIYDIHFKSTMKLTQIGLKHEPVTNGKRKRGRASVPEQLVFEPNYVRVAMLLKSAAQNNESGEKCAGLQLLKYRSNKAIQSNKTDLTIIGTQAETDWRELKQLTRARRQNVNVASTHNVTMSRRPKQQSTQSSKRRQVTPSPSDGDVSVAKTPAPSTMKGEKKRSPISAHRPRILFRPGQQLPKKLPRRRASIICAKCGRNNASCNVSEDNKISFHAAPSIPVERKSKNTTRASFLKREGKILHRKYVLDRMGCSKMCKVKKYCCEMHNFEWLEKTIEVEWKGKTLKTTYRMLVPEAIGKKSSVADTITVSKGVARDRALARVLSTDVNDHVINHSESLTIEDCDEIISDLQSQKPTTIKEKLRIAEEVNTARAAQVERLRSDLAQTNTVVQQMAEAACVGNQVPLNSSLQESIGLGMKRGNADTMKVRGKNFFHFSMLKLGKKDRKHYLADDAPLVNLNISAKEIKRRTSFNNIDSLLAFIFVVGNGDVLKIKERVSSLTWFEEWFLYLEYQNMRSVTRYDDVMATWLIDRESVVAIITHKGELEDCALRSWPRFASHEEDTALRCKEKWSQYNNLRPIMWDMTNVPAYQFTDSDLQRLTYSEYYSQCCFKGGVFTQLMGWQGVGDLWTGRITDTDYTKREGFLQAQRIFQENDKVIIDGEEKILPWLNIFDKGFRVNAAAWAEGEQLVLQPDFAKSDRRFSRLQTLASASVASDRGANERTVNVSKRAGHISRGFLPNMCPIRFNKAWKTAAFRANFMYRPVL
jgi:hypothetical protein